MNNPLGLKQKILDFYQRNLKKDVNLYTDKTTISGVINSYDKDSGVIILKNSIQRIYDEDGSSIFCEDNKDFELDTKMILIRQLSTREDRLGRIVKYNEDLKIEENERRQKLNPQNTK